MPSNLWPTYKSSVCFPLKRSCETELESLQGSNKLPRCTGSFSSQETVCVLRAPGLTERFRGCGARPEKYNSIKEMRHLISFSYLIQSQRRWPGFGSFQTDSGPHKYKPPHPPPIGLKERGTLRDKITVFVSVICKFIYSLKKPYW